MARRKKKQQGQTRPDPQSLMASSEISQEDAASLLQSLIAQTVNAQTPDAITTSTSRGIQSTDANTQEAPPMTVEQQVALSSGKKELGKKFEEAGMSGMSTTERFAEVGLDEFGQPLPQQDAAPNVRSKERSGSRNPLQLLSSLVQGVVDIVPTSATARLANTEAALNRQKLEQGGELGIEKEKQIIKAGAETTKFLDDFMANKPLGGEAATQFNLSTDLVNDTKQLQDILNINPNALEKLATPGNKAGQRVRDLVGKLKANLVALRGGKSLTANEEKIINTLIPKRGFSSKLQDRSSIDFQLQSIFDSASRQQRLLQPDAFAQGNMKKLRANGISDDVIMELHRLGELGDKNAQ
jgi:hypothetical protein